MLSSWLSQAIRSLRARRIPRFTREMSIDQIPEVDARIYRLRYKATSDLITGYGLEIGAGANPQQLPENVSCIYFDRRDLDGLQTLFQQHIDYQVHPIEDIPKYFPQGADFLIAHGVLEHSPDPIGLLRSWLSYVKDDGLLVLSLPDKHHCPQDAKRITPSFDHIVLDHLLSRGEDTFESKEHIYSFLLGWRYYILPHASKIAYLDFCLAEPRRSGHDLHWHALDRELGEKIIQTAGLLSGRAIHMCRICTVDSKPIRTRGEAIFVFRVRQRGETQDAYVDAVRAEIQRIADSLLSSGQVLSEAVQSWQNGDRRHC